MVNNKEIDDYETNEEEEELINALKEAEKQLSTYKSFFYGGWVEFPEEEKMKFLFQMLSNNDNDNDNEDEDNWTTIDLTNFPAKEVMDTFCQAAPFGDLKQQKTVYDPNVRLASECDANRFRFKNYEQTKAKKAKKK